MHGIIRELLAGIEKPIIFEIGAHNGTDTVKLAQIPGSRVYAFECDPRNKIPVLPNIIPSNYAISDFEGDAEFYLSSKATQNWTCSSSLKKPKHHLIEHPDIKFDEAVKVKCIPLDTFCKWFKIDRIDFIWADVQGAEKELIAGAKEILKKTKYLYTEFSNEETFEGQITLNEILSMLPGWEVLQQPDPWNVLLLNKDI